MISEKDVSVVGKVNKTHGINGELSASFYDEAVMDAIEPGFCLIFCIDGIYVPFFVNEVRPKGSETLLISLDGEDSKEEVAPLVGKEFFVLDSVLADLHVDTDDDSGLYAAQLIGYEVYTADGFIGKITDIDDNTDNPLFIVSDAAGQNIFFIPIVDDFITDIDQDDKRIEVDLPDGLLDINSANN